MKVAQLIQELEGKLDLDVEVDVELDNENIYGLQVVGFREENGVLVLVVGPE